MDLILFYRSIVDTLKCTHPMVSAYIVDLETKGKSNRQMDYDTQISVHTFKDVGDLSKITDKPIWVRVNGFPFFKEEEIRKAIDLGANEILLPMVRNCHEIERCLEIVSNQCRLGILIETNEAVENVCEFQQYNLSRMYIGLNDLSIERKSRNIFNPIVDGTIESLKRNIQVPFGYGGLTHTSLGAPIHCRLLLFNLIKNGADFTFLRRSFYKALAQYSADDIFKSIKFTLNQYQTIGVDEVQEINEKIYAQIVNIDKTDIELHNK